MKKLIALFVMTSILIIMASVATAVTPFEFRAYCNDTNRITYDTNPDHREDKSINDHQIYVRHWVTGGSSDYTNLFKARNVTDSVNYGSKWCTVGMNIPIQSNSIVISKTYTMAGRGNTNHYNYDGVVSLTLHGNFYPDL